MKRMLLVLAAVLFLNALAVPNVARADGPGTPPPNCNPNQICKP
jgi:hypothetical protein